MMKRGMLSLVYNNVDKCSGLCCFCNAANYMDYAQGINYNDPLSSIIKIDNETYDTYKADYDALEKTIINNVVFKTNDEMSWTIWGADPLGSFLVFQDVVDFLRDLHKRYNKI